MSDARRILGRLGGAFLLLHGLAHGVIPLRGLGVSPHRLRDHLITAGWMAAMVAFTGAGVGALGAPIWRRYWPALAFVGAVGSAVTLIGASQRELLPGLLIDAAILVFALRASEPPIPFRRQKVSRGRRVLRIVGGAVATGWVSYVALTAFTRPWRQTWGMRPEELARSLPGDPRDRVPEVEVNHAVTIDAPPEAVWPWLNQMGQDRGGFYSYAWLENLFGLRIHNAERIHPEWQYQREGEFVRAAPPGWLGGVGHGRVGFTLDLHQPPRAFGLKGWGRFVLEPEGARGTRLIVRSKFGDPAAPAWGAIPTMALLDLPHFVMEQRMLKTIRMRAETHWQSGAPVARQLRAPTGTPRPAPPPPP